MVEDGEPMPDTLCELVLQGEKNGSSLCVEAMDTLRELGQICGSSADVLVLLERERTLWVVWELLLAG